MRFRGSGIAIGQTAQRVLGVINALDQVIAGRPPLRRREMRGPQGELIGHLDWPHTLYFLERRRLLECLLRVAADAGVVLQTGSEVVRAEPGGQVELGDGTVLSADLVIVADGAGSRLRRSVAADAWKTDLPYGAARALAPKLASDVDIPDNAWAEYWSGKRRLFFAPLSANSVYLAFNCSRHDLGPRAGDRDLVEIDLPSWKRSFPSLAHVIDRITEPPMWAPFVEVAARPWSNGRIVMIGDAAHAMTPALGAGGTTAMMDAVSLALALEHGADLTDTLGQWESYYRSPIQRLQRDSRFWGDVGYWPNVIQKALIWLTPHSRWLTRKRFESTDFVPSNIVASSDPPGASPMSHPVPSRS